MSDPFWRKADPRVPPGQVVTQKFPVMTAGTPRTVGAAEWTLRLSIETFDGSERDLGAWDYAQFRALRQTDVTCDIHCVTRWSKLDTRWRGVLLDDVLAAVGAEAEIAAADAAGDPSFPIRYLRAEADGGYSANLKLEDLRGAQAMVALDYDDAPLAAPHGGPARLLVPKLYFWKSAKWVRRLVLSPFDRKGYWERLGYHNYGDPWREQRYRGETEHTHRTTLDPALSVLIRKQRAGKKRVQSDRELDRAPDRKLDEG